mgnify:CR=1 FL=1
MQKISRWLSAENALSTNIVPRHRLQFSIVRKLYHVVVTEVGIPTAIMLSPTDADPAVENLTLN